MLGRFLQADPRIDLRKQLMQAQYVTLPRAHERLIQDPLNSQSHNRYTYVFNNPLSLTDPSGYRSLSANVERYWWPVLAVAAVIVTGNIAAAHSTMASVATTMGKVASSAGWNTLASSFATIAAGHTTTAGLWAMGGGFLAGGISSGSLRGAVMGAVEAGLSFGIGRAIDAHNLGGFAGNMSMHALKGGVLAEFSSGDFGHGFKGAAFNKISGRVISQSRAKFGTKVAMSALAGGMISSATGGKFGTGAVSAAIQYAYNECISGKGCWVNDEERAFAANGDWRNYYKTSGANFDPYGKRGGEVAANEEGFITWATNVNLDLAILKNLAGESELNKAYILGFTKEYIRVELMREHVRALDSYGATAENPVMLDRYDDIGRFHDRVFDKFGAGRDIFSFRTFGGYKWDFISTLSFGLARRIYDWCPPPSCKP